MEQLPLPGDVALSAVVALHGLVMNGGVHHALEVLSPTELRDAIDGFRYFSLAVIAELLVRAVTITEDAANQRYWAAIPDDAALQSRFLVALRKSPKDFAPVQ